MFRKTYKVVVLAIVLGVLLNACSKRQAVTEEYNTISDLAYSEKCKIEPIIYIEEKAGFVPYIVLTNDYNGKTLLLRKELKDYKFCTLYKTASRCIMKYHYKKNGVTII